MWTELNSCGIVYRSRNCDGKCAVLAIGKQNLSSSDSVEDSINTPRTGCVSSDLSPADHTHVTFIDFPWQILSVRIKHPI